MFGSRTGPSELVYRANADASFATGRKEGGLPRAFGRGVAALAALAMVAMATIPAAATAAGPETDDCPNAAYRTGASANLPDCRAFERVSPADLSNGLPGLSNKLAPMVAKAAPSGERFMYFSSGPLGEGERGSYNTMNMASRTSEGWKSFGAFTSVDPEVPMDLAATAPIAPYPSEDATRVAFRTDLGLGGPNPRNQSIKGSMYLTAPEGIGPPTWLSQPSPGISTVNTTASLALGGSPDLSTVYFLQNSVLTDLYGDENRNPANRHGLYMYRDGTLTPAGRLPSGLVDPGGAMPAGSGSTAQVTSYGLAWTALRNTVSRDGSRLFFVSPQVGASRQLYVQIDGGPGQLISKDAEGDPAASGVVDLRSGVTSSSNWTGEGFAFANRDGTKVLFRSASALAPGAPADATLKTYRATVSPDAVTVEYLPQVVGMPLQLSEDGTKVFFARGLTSTTADLLFWDETRPGGEPYLLAPGVSVGLRTVIYQRLTPDGSTLVFTGSLGAVAATEVYRWQVGDPELTCLSCRTDGVPTVFGGAATANSAAAPTQNIAFSSASADTFNQGTLSYTQVVSDDGRRVFFNTTEPLDPVRDTNSWLDIYMWEDGELHLITTGKGNAPSFILDSSASGDDVFFTTRDALVADDYNQEYDVYTARVNGGFPDRTPPECVGVDCRGAASAAPVLPSLGSMSFAGSGNRPAAPNPRASVGVARLKPVTGARARLRVRVPRAGRVSVAGSRITHRSVSVSKAGVYPVRIVLNRKGRKALRKRGKLSVNARVVYRAQGGGSASKPVKVTFKQPKAKRAKAKRGER